MAKLIFGCGYLGLRVAQRWRSAGETIFALTRSEARAAELKAAGIEPIVGDLTNTGAMLAVPPASTVLFAVGHDRNAGPSIQDVFVAGLSRALAALGEGVERFIYVSSVGVYGQNDGSWVDEQSPCLPTRLGGQACLAAEKLLAESRVGPRSIVLRAGGIYGPGRIPRRADLAAGKPIAAPAEGYVNLIHVDDLATAVLAAEGISPPQLLAVTDGNPVLRRDYYGELARLLGAPPPTFTAASAGDPVTERAKSDKRVRNALLRAVLPTLKFAHPTYREGLRAIIAEEEAAADSTAP